MCMVAHAANGERPTIVLARDASHVTPQPGTYLCRNQLPAQPRSENDMEIQTGKGVRHARFLTDWHCKTNSQSSGWKPDSERCFLYPTISWWATLGRAAGGRHFTRSRENLDDLGGTSSL